jgi:hypothetical protein
MSAVNKFSGPKLGPKCLWPNGLAQFGPRFPKSGKPPSSLSLGPAWLTLGLRRLSWAEAHAGLREKVQVCTLNSSRLIQHRFRDLLWLRVAALVWPGVCVAPLRRKGAHERCLTECQKGSGGATRVGRRCGLATAMAATRSPAEKVPRREGRSKAPWQTWVRRAQARRAHA